MRVTLETWWMMASNSMPLAASNLPLGAKRLWTHPCRGSLPINPIAQGPPLFNKRPALHSSSCAALPLLSAISAWAPNVMAHLDPHTMLKQDLLTITYNM